MAKKQTLTDVKITQDIINVLKYPPKMAKRPYIISIILIYALYILPLLLAPILLHLTLIIYFFIFIGSIVFLIGRRVFISLSLRSVIKKLSLADYTISTQIVIRTSHEHYKEIVAGARRHLRKVHIYVIHFANGKSWRIPKYN